VSAGEIGLDSRHLILSLPWTEMEEQQAGKGTACGALEWCVGRRWLGWEEWAAPCHGTLGSAQPEELQAQLQLTTGLGAEI